VASTPEHDASVVKCFTVAKPVNERTGNDTGFTVCLLSRRRKRNNIASSRQIFQNKDISDLFFEIVPLLASIP
jgi:hypothetical protein